MKPKSKLDPYANFIRRLALEGRTLREIRASLASQKPPCEISIARLHAWMVSYGQPPKPKHTRARYRLALRKGSEKQEDL